MFYGAKMASITHSNSDRDNGNREPHNTLLTAGLSLAKWSLGLVVGLGGIGAALEVSREKNHTLRASSPVSGIDIDPEHRLVRIATSEGETIAPVDSVTALPLKPGDQARCETVEETSALPSWATLIVPEDLHLLSEPRNKTRYVLHLPTGQCEKIEALKPPANPEDVLKDPIKHLGEKITYQIPEGLEPGNWYGIKIGDELYRVQTFSDQLGLTTIKVLSPDGTHPPGPGDTVTGRFDKVDLGNKNIDIVFWQDPVAVLQATQPPPTKPL